MLQVLFDGQILIAGQRLRNDADHAAHCVGVLAHIVAADNCPPARDRDQRGHHADQRALACAVGAEQTEDLPFRDREAHAFHGFEIAVALDDVFDRDAPRGACAVQSGPASLSTVCACARHCFTSFAFGM